VLWHWTPNFQLCDLSQIACAQIWNGMNQHVFESTSCCALHLKSCQCGNKYFYINIECIHCQYKSSLRCQNQYVFESTTCCALHLKSCQCGNKYFYINIKCIHCQYKSNLRCQYKTIQTLPKACSHLYAVTPSDHVTFDHETVRLCHTTKA